MELDTLAADLAELIGVTPATMVLYIIILRNVCNIIARRIPDDATGALGFVRQVCAILGAHVSSKVTADLTVKDIAKAAADVPVIAAKAETAAKA